MDLKALSEPLSAKQIEFRVQSISKYGHAKLLVYKNARVDMDRLNTVCGPLGWQRSHSRDNKNCIVSIYDSASGCWVGKEDTGTESNTESEKGLASDSFKRACVNWGLGIELYDYPEISIKLNGNGPELAQGDKTTEWYLHPKQKDKYGGPKPVTSWNFKLKEWVWYSEFDDGKLSFLAAQDNLGKLRFTHGKRKQK